MNIKMIVGLLFCLSLTGCKTTANYDYDNSVNFSKISTYAWVVESKKSSEDSSYYLSDISHRRMIEAIDNTLLNKGLTKVPPGKADILVNYHAAINIKRERAIEPTHSFYWNFGNYYRGNNFGWGYDFSRQTREYKEGTLVIDFISNQHQLIWRGSKGARLTSKRTPQQRTADINQTVTTILTQFPPQK